jgi:YD repeat-containing protein
VGGDIGHGDADRRARRRGEHHAGQREHHHEPEHLVRHHVISDGKRVEVWRGPQGGTTELVIETDAATILGSTKMSLETRLCTASFDNVQFIAPDPVTTTYAYNDANEMTTSTAGGVTTTYTYDAWGRVVTKADGTHTATYLWRFGSLLKNYDTNFPGEKDVAYNYDGLLRRRVKLEN